MKKILAILSILFLTIGMALGATTETATVTLNATIAETSFNSGIKVKSGDLSGVISDTATFETNFDGSSDSVLIDVGEVSATGASGYFSVLVKRATTSAITVDVEATPMKKVIGAPYYLGFKIIEKGELTVLLDTTLNPATGATGLTYSADNVYDDSVRDTKVFKYEVPQNTLAPLGDYSTDISFSITIE